MELFRLFITASIPVLKVLLVTALGSYLALDRVNILGAETRKHLNTIVFYVFNPALVSSNLAKTITYDSMVKLWFMPVNILITFIIGSILGWIVIQFTRPPTHLRGLILGCCAAGNLGNLLLIIIPAVCKEKGSPFGNSGACYTYGLAYASLSMAIGAIYLWSYVYNIVRISSRSSKDTGGKDFSISKSSRESSISDLGNRTEPLLSSKEFGVTEDDIDHYALPRTLSEGKAELVGFAIGIVPQIRKSLIGDEAPLRVIQDTASLLGEGAIPTLTLIIGGNLLKGLKGSGMQKSIILGIVLARYIALPLTGMLIVKGAIRLGFVHSDPLYQFVLLLQFALPPAMNIGTITQLFGAGESECSVIMLWTYALASISLTFWSTFFMWLVV
ncbi:protein PIN-LIKES 3 isoform X2 [Ziziphus jujuba]|uniref:Protein PIN-LIKES 3 isoform X2 n=1 Tax=Ziziphus jujuba TaxID=326968 RepID=A0ABM3INY7_ZIZJJ|nr:protein PIN-LIKES 3 isoform X2 [Ziziphus jujuba]